MSQKEEKTVFSKIIDRELPSNIIFENDEIIIIETNAPKARIHLLGITKEPFLDIDNLLQDEKNKDLLWSLYSNLSKVAHQLGIAESGYRLTTNIGHDGGQQVPHLHVHLMGGEKLRV